MYVRCCLDKRPVTLGYYYNFYIAQISLIIFTHFVFDCLTYLQCLLFHINFT